MKARLPRFALATLGLLGPAAFAWAGAAATPTPALKLPADLPAEVRGKIEARMAELAKLPPGQPQSTLGPPMAVSVVPADARLELMIVQESRSKASPPPGAPAGGAIMMGGPAGGQAYLGVAVSGSRITSSARLRGINITRATDDLDRDLVMPPAAAAARGGAAMTSPLNLMMNPGGAAANIAVAPVLRATGYIQLPQRDARKIKFVEGEVEVYAPAATGGSVVVIKSPSAAGSPAEPDPMLAKHAIEAKLLTKETYPEAKASLPQMGPDPTFMNSVAIFLKDPNSQVAGWMIQDAAGKPLATGGMSSRGSIATGWVGEIRFTTPPPADAQIAIYVATPEAVMKLPFRFENIELP